MMHDAIVDRFHKMNSSPSALPPFFLVVVPLFFLMHSSLLLEEEISMNDWISRFKYRAPHHNSISLFSLSNIMGACLSGDAVAREEILQLPMMRPIKSK